MSGKQEKRIRAQAKAVTVEWLKSLVNEEEASKININNYKQRMPNQTHFYLRRCMRLQSYSLKWMVKRIKKILKSQPSKDLTAINLEDINGV